MKIINSYKEIAQFYDIDTVNQDDINLFLKYIRPSESVLDICCGTGRVSIPLARNGSKICAIDFSTEMLNIFRYKIRNNKISGIDVHEADMTSFNLGNSFDWVILPGCGFQSLKNNNQRLKFFGNLSRHVSENSNIIITLFNPSPNILNSWGKTDIEVFNRKFPNLGFALRKTVNQLSINKNEQILSSKYIFQKIWENGTIEEYSDEIEIGYLFPNQCREFFEENGFEIIREFGSYFEEPILDNVFRDQIYFLKPKKSGGANK